LKTCELYNFTVVCSCPKTLYPYQSSESPTEMYPVGELVPSSSKIKSLVDFCADITREHVRESKQPFGNPKQVLLSPHPLYISLGSSGIKEIADGLAPRSCV